jgi:hypothetical protein
MDLERRRPRPYHARRRALVDWIVQLEAELDRARDRLERIRVHERAKKRRQRRARRARARAPLLLPAFASPPNPKEPPVPDLIPDKETVSKLFAETPATLPTLDELKARALPRLTPEDLFTSESLAAHTDHDRATLREYFARFVKSHGDCIRCGRPHGGGILGAFLGRGFTWGLVNGEGFCGSCRYPGRAYHRDVGPITFLNLILQYHPDGLEERNPHADEVVDADARS